MYIKVENIVKDLDIIVINELLMYSVWIFYRCADKNQFNLLIRRALMCSFYFYLYNQITNCYNM